jgi:hypothetical protein
MSISNWISRFDPEMLVKRVWTVYGFWIRKVYTYFSIFTPYSSNLY